MNTSADPYPEIRNPIGVKFSTWPRHFDRLFIKLVTASEHFSPNLHPFSDLWNKHSGGCLFSQNGVVQVPSK